MVSSWDRNSASAAGCGEPWCHRCFHGEDEGLLSPTY